MSFKTIWKESVLHKLRTREQIEQAAEQVYSELNNNWEHRAEQEDMNIERFWQQRPDRMAVLRRTHHIHLRVQANHGFATKLSIKGGSTCDPPT